MKFAQGFRIIIFNKASYNAEALMNVLLRSLINDI